jgi:uncharacterized cupin superfamily protein
MIIRKDQAEVDRGTEEEVQMYGAFESLHLSDAGGLTEFGTHVQTLQPGSRSSDRHWHEKGDESLYVISGEATVVEEDGAHLLRPGDAGCWPAGAANAHQVVDRSDAPCTYLVVGSRGALHTVTHYPDRGEILYDFDDGSWQLQRTDGTLIKEGNPDQGSKMNVAHFMSRSGGPLASYSPECVEGIFCEVAPSS